MTRRQALIALAVLYVLVHVVIGVYYVVTGDMTVADRLLVVALLAALPAGAFAMLAVPLLRGSRNRVVLTIGAIVAVVIAALQLMLTWGVSLPLSSVLIVLAFVAMNRAAAVSGVRRAHRTVLLAVLVATLLAIPTVGLGVESVIVVLVIAGVACLLLAATGRRPV